MGWSAQCVCANSRRMRKAVFCRIAGIVFMLSVLTCGFIRIPLVPFAESVPSRNSQFLESTRTEQVSITIPGPITSGFQDNLNLQQEQSARCGEDYNLQKPTYIFSWGRQKHMKTEKDAVEYNEQISPSSAKCA